MTESTSAARNVIEVRNPATGEKIGEVKSYTVDEAREAVARAGRAQRRWAEVGLEERARVLRRFRDILLDRAEEVCELITRENGKVLQESFEAEIFPTVDMISYYTARVHDVLAPRRLPMHLLKHRRSYIHYRPRGVMLVIAPWNFPFVIPMTGVVFGLLAGNAVVLKPASLTPLCALKARELFDEAGLDADLFQVLPGPGRLGSDMIEMGVGYVNFTGSTAVGIKVSELCGRHLIACSMELGGKAPAIVMPDADLDVVTGSLVWGAFANAGQICASVERAYVHESLYDEVVRRVSDRARELRVGNGLVDGTDMGPMTDPAQLAIVARQVDDALAHGAKAVTGGRRLDGPGQFYPPTVLTDVGEDMEVAHEETFGPVLPIMRYRGTEEVIERANHSPYGLTAYVFTRDRDEGRRVAERLEAGSVLVNEVLISYGLPETPWQGVKMSGTGRVHSDEGLRDLTIGYHVNEDAVPVRWSPFWQPYSHRMYRTLMSVARTLDRSGVGAKAAGARDLVGGLLDLVRNR